MRYTDWVRARPGTSPAFMAKTPRAPRSPQPPSARPDDSIAHPQEAPATRQRTRTRKAAAAAPVTASSDADGTAGAAEGAPAGTAKPRTPRKAATAGPSAGGATQTTGPARTKATAAAKKAAAPKASARTSATPRKRTSATGQQQRDPGTLAARADAPARVSPGARRSLRVLMVASEAAPYSKTGGLADVVAALPRALAALGHQVTVVVPRYRGIGVEGTEAVGCDVDMGGHRYQVTAYVREDAPGVRVVLVDQPALFDREGIYGVGSQDYDDNPRRFAVLSLAALEFARRDGQPVDIVHGHDWPAGLVPIYLRTRYADDPVLGRAATVFTIHNVAFKGLCAADWLPQLGIDWDWFTVDGLEYWLHVSMLKGGIVASDVITTVSRRYAQEIQTPEMAFGFDGVVRAHRDRLIGIRNGIDTDAWNPSTDEHLPVRYDATSVAEGKAAAKRRVLEVFGLPADEGARRPLLAMISRMVDQKGLDLIAGVVDELPALGASIVVMGEGEPWYEEMWRGLASRHPGQIAVRVGFEEGLSHLMEAGADLVMMPSRYEPCGLNQMYSMRYGTIPVVRATGGLADTVEDYQPATGSGTGFVFAEPTGQALLGALRRALDVWHHAPEAWRTLQRNGMSRDFSWAVSARAYLEAYDQALGRVPTRLGAAAQA